MSLQQGIEVRMLYEKILMAFLIHDVVVLVSQGLLKDLEECLHQELVKGERHEEERRYVSEREI